MYVATLVLLQARKDLRRVARTTNGPNETVLKENLLFNKTNEYLYVFKIHQRGCSGNRV